MSADTKPVRSYLKWFLDLAMAVTFLLLLNTHVLGGLPFHEIAGSVIGLVFAVHVLLNWQWVVNVTRRISDQRQPGKIRFGYWLNWLLFVSMALIIFSGILISRVVYPQIQFANKRWVGVFHMTVSFVIIAVVAIHLGLHWNWIVSVFQSIYRVGLQFGRRKKAVVLLGAIVLAMVVSIPAYRSQRTTLAVAGESLGNQMGPRSDAPGRDQFRPDELRRGDGPRERGGERGRRNRFFGPWRILMSYGIIMALVAWATMLIEGRLGRRRIPGDIEIPS